MEVRVCKNCRRLFKYIYGPEVCPDCTKSLAEEKKQQNDNNNQNEKSSQNEQNNQGNHNSYMPYSSKLQTNAHELHNTTNNNPAGSLLKPLPKDEDAKFNQVRDYIMSNPKASVAQISELNDIQPTKLFDWIRDERLEFSNDSEYAWFNCERCGSKIKSGRVCNRCKAMK